MDGTHPAFLTDLLAIDVGDLLGQPVRGKYDPKTGAATLTAWQGVEYRLPAVNIRQAIDPEALARTIADALLPRLPAHVRRGRKPTRRAASKQRRGRLH